MPRLLPTFNGLEKDAIFRQNQLTLTTPQKSIGLWKKIDF